MLPEGYLFTGSVTAALVVVCVLIHYEGMRVLSDNLPPPQEHPRRRLVTILLSMQFLHIVSIWIFGVAYYFLLDGEIYGVLDGLGDPTLINCIYYSAIVYTTIGFGDIIPHGAVRTMTGTEGIVGLTLIAWSASYTFVEMLKTWDGDDN